MEDKLLPEIIASWVLDGGCTCISCKPDDGGNLQCEESPEKAAEICSALKTDIGELLAKMREVVEGIENPFGYGNAVDGEGYKYRGFVIALQAILKELE